MQVSWIDAERLRELVAQIAPQQENTCELATDRSVDPHSGNWQEPIELLSGLSEPLAFVSQSASTSIEPDREEIAEILEPENNGPATAVMPLSRIRDKLRAIRQRASEAGILSRAGDGTKTDARLPPPSPTVDSSSPAIEPATTGADDGPCGSPLAQPNHTPPPFEIPQGSQEQRLAAFARWASQWLDDDGSHVLVMNGDGDVLWGGEAKAGLVLSAMMAWGSAMHATTLPPNGVPGVMRASLASGHMLTVVPCETAAGVLHAAVVAPKAVPEATAALLQGALAAAIS